MRSAKYTGKILSTVVIFPARFDIGKAKFTYPKIIVNSKRKTGGDKKQ